MPTKTTFEAELLRELAARGVAEDLWAQALASSAIRWERVARAFERVAREACDGKCPKAKAEAKRNAARASDERDKALRALELHKPAGHDDPFGLLAPLRTRPAVALSATSAASSTSAGSSVPEAGGATTESLNGAHARAQDSTAATQVPSPITEGNE